MVFGDSWYPGTLRRKAEDYASRIEFDAETHTYLDKESGKIVPSVTDIMWPLTVPGLSQIPQSILAKAAERGTRVHNAIHLYETTKYDEFDKTTQAYFNQYLGWRKTMVDDGYVIVASEYQVVQDGLAGTVDQIWIRSDKQVEAICVVDFKTSRKPSLPIWQLQGYMYAGMVYATSARIVHLQERSSVEYKYNIHNLRLELKDVVQALKIIDEYGREK